MNNYEFSADFAAKHLQSTNDPILDFGCGAGRTVEILREKGLNGFGCDVFDEGCKNKSKADQDLFSQEIILEMKEGKIPFEDNYFSVLINNQVLEHIEDWDLALSEMKRVLKPGGTLLSIFPYKWVFLEAHLKIPMIHWLSKENPLRFYYIVLMYALKFGRKNRRGRSFMEWCRGELEWLSKWTYYRNYHEVKVAMDKYFTEWRHIENDWLKARLKKNRWTLSLLPPFFTSWIARHWSGLVIVAKKQ